MQPAEDSCAYWELFCRAELSDFDTISSHMYFLYAQFGGLNAVYPELSAYGRKRVLK